MKKIFTSVDYIFCRRGLRSAWRTSPNKQEGNQMKGNLPYIEINGSQAGDWKVFIHLGNFIWRNVPLAGIRASRLADANIGYCDKSKARSRLCINKTAKETEEEQKLLSPIKGIYIDQKLHKTTPREHLENKGLNLPYRMGSTIQKTSQSSELHSPHQYSSIDIKGECSYPHQMKSTIEKHLKRPEIAATISMYVDKHQRHEQLPPSNEVNHRKAP
eukprot:gene6344-11779_t